MSTPGSRYYAEALARAGKWGKAEYDEANFLRARLRAAKDEIADLEKRLPRWRWWRIGIHGRDRG